MKKLACDISALTSAELRKSFEDSIALFKSAEEVKELPDGYGVRFKNSSQTLNRVYELTSVNRICCPFLRQTVIIDAEKGPVWLHFTGGEGVKEFVATDMVNILPEEVAEKAGLKVKTA